MTLEKIVKCTPNGIWYNFYPVVKRSGRELPLLLLAHANGFCKEIWEPIVERARKVQPYFQVAALDLSGHGDSIANFSEYHAKQFAFDVISCLGDIEQEHKSCVIGMGHSIGATALLGAQIINPKLFCHLQLLEPIILPVSAPNEDLLLVKLAKKRRRVFRDHNEARDRWVSNPTFSTWDPDLFAAYVQFGLKGNDIDGYELKCDPAYEAKVYAHGCGDMYPELETLDSSITIDVGRKSTNFGFHDRGTVGYYEDVVIPQIKNCKLNIVNDTGHLLLMEKPNYFANVMAKLASVGESSL